MADGPSHTIDDETRPLLGVDSQIRRSPNPLPKLQLGIVLLLQVCEPITSQSIYPYINQVGIVRKIKRASYPMFDSLLLNLISLEGTNVRLGTMLD